MKFIIAILSMIMLLQPVAAGQQTNCQKDTAYNQFDFWLGEWDVHSADGKLQGINKITKSADGCLIKEAWESTMGGKGFSMNYYNPRTGKWTQNWVSGGTIIDYEGGLKDKSMILEGMIHYQAQALSTKFRGTWTLLEDGRVRQFFEQYNAEKDTWGVWFEGFYSKKNTKKNSKVNTKE